MRKSLIIIMLLGAIGCGTFSATVSTSNVTKPVLVGKVTKIKGMPQNDFGMQSANFEVSVEDSVVRSVAGPDEMAITSTAEGANKLDVELSDLIAKEPKGTLIVHDISFIGKNTDGLSYFLLALVSGGRANLMDEGVWVQVNGGVYTQGGNKK